MRALRASYPRSPCDCSDNLWACGVTILAQNLPPQRHHQVVRLMPITRSLVNKLKFQNNISFSLLREISKKEDPLNSTSSEHPLVHILDPHMDITKKKKQILTCFRITMAIITVNLLPDGFFSRIKAIEETSQIGRSSIWCFGSRRIRPSSEQASIHSNTWNSTAGTS